MDSFMLRELFSELLDEYAESQFDELDINSNKAACKLAKKYLRLQIYEWKSRISEALGCMPEEINLINTDRHWPESPDAD